MGSKSTDKSQYFENQAVKDVWTPPSACNEMDSAVEEILKTKFYRHERMILDRISNNGLHVSADSLFYPIHKIFDENLTRFEISEIYSSSFFQQLNDLAKANICVFLKDIPEAKQHLSRFKHAQKMTIGFTGAVGTHKFLVNITNTFLVVEVIQKSSTMPKFLLETTKISFRDFYVEPLSSLCILVLLTEIEIIRHTEKDEVYCVEKIEAIVERINFNHKFRDSIHVHLLEDEKCGNNGGLNSVTTGSHGTQFHPMQNTAEMRNSRPGSTSRERGSLSNCTYDCSTKKSGGCNELNTDRNDSQDISAKARPTYENRSEFPSTRNNRPELKFQSGLVFPAQIQNFLDQDCQCCLFIREHSFRLLSDSITKTHGKECIINSLSRNHPVTIQDLAPYQQHILFYKSLYNKDCYAEYQAILDNQDRKIHELLFLSPILLFKDQLRHLASLLFKNHLYMSALGIYKDIGYTEDIVKCYMGYGDTDECRRSTLQLIDSLKNELAEKVALTNGRNSEMSKFSDIRVCNISTDVFKKSNHQYPRSSEAPQSVMTDLKQTESEGSSDLCSDGSRIRTRDVIGQVSAKSDRNGGKDVYSSVTGRISDTEFDSSVSYQIDGIEVHSPPNDRASIKEDQNYITNKHRLLINTNTKCHLVDNFSIQNPESTDTLNIILHESFHQTKGCNSETVNDISTSGHSLSQNHTKAPIEMQTRHDCPNDPLLYLRAKLSDAFLLLANLDQNVEYFDAAINTLDYFETRRQACIFHFHAKEYSKALFHINKALEYNLSPRILFLKASILVQMQNYQEALKTYDQFLVFDNKNNQVFSNMALCHIHLGNYHKCLDVLERSLQLLPTSNLAKLYKDIGTMHGFTERIETFLKKIGMSAK